MTVSRELLSRLGDLAVFAVYDADGERIGTDVQGAPADPPVDLPGEVAAALEAARAADDRAENARQMVLKRDPRLVAAEDAVVALMGQVELLAGRLAELTARVSVAPAAAGDVAALAARVGVLERRHVALEHEIVRLGAVAAGARDVAVTWDVPFPAADYAVRPELEAGSLALLANLSAVLKPGSRTPGGCVITVRNSGLASVAAVVLDVIGFYDGVV